MPKPFDPVKHERLLGLGKLEFGLNNEKNAMRIYYRNSNQAGFGTASMRHVVDASFKAGFEGKVGNDASWSSHLFHLYMGMQPELRDYITANYGDMCALNIHMIFAKDEIVDLKEVGAILKDGKKIDANKDVDVEDVIDNLEYLEKLLNTNTVSNRFIENLITTLEDQKNEKRPNTRHWGSMFMELSEAGKARWKDAIDNQLEFEPFKRFEHLRQFMNPEQNARLDAALLARENLLIGKNESATSSITERLRDKAKELQNPEVEDENQPRPK